MTFISSLRYTAIQRTLRQCGALASRCNAHTLERHVRTIRLLGVYTVCILLFVFLIIIKWRMFTLTGVRNLKMARALQQRQCQRTHHLWAPMRCRIPSGPRRSCITSRSRTSRHRIWSIRWINNEIRTWVQTQSCATVIYLLIIEHTQLMRMRTTADLIANG